MLKKKCFNKITLVFLPIVFYCYSIKVRYFAPLKTKSSSLAPVEPNILFCFALFLILEAGFQTKKIWAITGNSFDTRDIYVL